MRMSYQLIKSYVCFIVCRWIIFLTLYFCGNVKVIISIINNDPMMYHISVNSAPKISQNVPH